MSSTAEFRQAFVARLKDACDRCEAVPPPHKGRQQFFSKALDLAPESISKWFNGVSMPRPDKMVELAELLGVEQTWLAFGVAPEMDREERKTHGREIDGAVYFALGTAMLSGVPCGLPGEKDRRAHYVDFYATIRGSATLVKVSLGREITPNVYEFVVPTQYPELLCVGVVPSHTGKHVLIQLTEDLIDEHRVVKSSGYGVTITVDSAKPRTDSSIWPVIRSFSDIK